MLVGQIVNPQNVPCSGTQVSLRSNQQELAVAQTDANGYFAFSGMKSGSYEVATANGQVPCRVWAPQTAPPAAQPGLLLIDEQPTTLGQRSGGLRSALANPLVIGAVIATAVAVPVIIHNANDDDPSSP